MLTMIPTYKVIVGPDDEHPYVMRVPRDKLDAYLHTLLFNGVGDFRVTREDEPALSPKQAE